MALHFSHAQADGGIVAIQTPNFMVEIPHKGSKVPFGSKIPDNPKYPTAIAREHDLDFTGMDEAQVQDAERSALQEHGKPPPTPIDLPQSETIKSSKSRNMIQKPSLRSRKPTRQEIVKVAQTVTLGERFHALPAAFEQSGRLKPGFGKLQSMMRKVQHMVAVQQNPDHISREKPLKNSPKKPRRTEVESLLETTGTDPESLYSEDTQQPSSQPGFYDSVKSCSSLNASHIANSASGVSSGAIASGPQVGPISSNERPETITCSDEDCAKKQFDAEYLNKYCGIQLRNAQDEQRKGKFWLCPECAHRAKIVNGYLGPVVHGSITRLPKFGNEQLQDEVLRDSLRQMSGQLANYIATATNKSILPNARMSILDNVCVRDEILDPAAGPTKPIVPLLRNLLNVPDGVTIKEKAESCQLHEYRNSIWIRAVLVSVFSDVVFHYGSPFNDDLLLRESLQDTGLQPDLIESIAQDIRIRTVRGDPPPKEFAERLVGRHLSVVKHLNCLMLPLVGADSVFDGLHKCIATIAAELNSNVSTDTKGEFEPITPIMGDPFDPHFHKWTNREQDARDCAGQTILAITMIGIKFRLPGREWRVCCRAEVEIFNAPSVSAEPRVSTIVPSKRPFPK